MSQYGEVEDEVSVVWHRCWARCYMEEQSLGMIKTQSPVKYHKHGLSKGPRQTEDSHSSGAGGGTGARCGEAGVLGHGPSSEDPCKALFTCRSHIKTLHRHYRSQPFAHANTTQLHHVRSSSTRCSSDEANHLLHAPAGDTAAA